MPKKAVEEQYKKLKQREHVLVRPDTYVGSIERDEKKVWILDSATKTMVEKKVTFVPALYKIFDEILVNAADNKQRDSSMKEIRVSVNVEKGSVTIRNDGKGIPVVIHKDHDIYVPELIFGHLLTSSNYDDKQKKTTGGRNGYGAKLANIFSKKFIIETVDSSNKRKYRQVWRNNMVDKSEPDIESSSSKDYTKVTFYPDFERFGMENGFKNEDILKIFEKRVYDIAGTTPKDLNVYYNQEKINCKTFIDYSKLYCGTGLKKNTDYFHYSDETGHWEVIYVINNDDTGHKEVSFVNNIWTITGGTHVNHVLNQFIKYFKDNFKCKGKEIKSLLKPQYIKDHIFIFINSLIVNPAFDSQTKEKLTTKVSNFGTKFSFPDELNKKLLSKIQQKVKQMLQFKMEQQSKKTDGKSKKKRLHLEAEIDDAAEAGTKNSHKCTLILTEGLSAKTLAVAGISELDGGKKLYGVMPLRGKLLNVRDCSQAKINNNKEIANLKQLLNLKQGVDYSDDRNFKQLRYGKIMIMTDQDHDGSHIKGLVINFIHSQWSSLLQKRPGFVEQFITPIVVVTKKGQKKKKIAFYTIPEYEKWKKENNNGKGWIAKYFKGLGSWKREEGKEHFQRISEHRIAFKYRNENDDLSIIKAFSKNEIEARKEWLKEFEPGTYLDFHNIKKSVTYNEFVDKELILFSMSDNKRSIPSIMDGLKPGQRKVLYSCFLKNNLKKEIKVSQLAGYISEKSAYHHGEASLYSTIIHMAQDFVGSNNINLLKPNGMFGSRIKGGSDAASPRYIFTQLNPITRNIFHSNDDLVLKYLDDDGYPVEPEYYVPIIPMILVNGCEGIGTGWSTSVPTYNPKDIIQVIRKKLNGENWNIIHPWFRGFEGIIDIIETKNTDTDKITYSYKTFGNYEIIDNTKDDKGNNIITIKITELPIQMWTENYKKFLLDMEDAEQIIEFKDLSSDLNVYFEIKIAQKNRPKKASNSKSKKGIDKYLDDENSTMSLSKSNSKSPSKDNKKQKIKKKLYWTGEMVLTEEFLKDIKLISSISTSNMVLFDCYNKLKKYDNVIQILEHFYQVRYKTYEERKELMLNLLQHDLLKLSNQARFILLVLEDKLIIKKKSKKKICIELKTLQFDLWSPKALGKQGIKSKLDELGINEDDENENENEESTNDIDDEKTDEIGKLVKGYNYLLNMPLWSLTKEKVEDLLNKKQQKETEIDILHKTTIKDLWKRDLDELENKLDEYDKIFEKEKKEQEEKNKKKLKKGKNKNIDYTKSKPFRESKFVSITTNNAALTKKGKKSKSSTKTTSINTKINSNSTSNTTSINKKITIPDNPFAKAKQGKKIKMKESKQEKETKKTKGKFYELSDEESDDIPKTSFMDRVKEKVTPTKETGRKRKLVSLESESSDNDGDVSFKVSQPPKKKLKSNTNSSQSSSSSKNTKKRKLFNPSNDDSEYLISNKENDSELVQKRESPRLKRHVKTVKYTYDDDSDDDEDVSEIVAPTKRKIKVIDSDDDDEYDGVDEEEEEYVLGDDDDDEDFELDDD